MKEASIKELKTRLWSLLKKYAFRLGKVRLSSGKVSNYYLDARKVTLHPEGAYLVAEVILRMIKKDKINAIGGPTIGADPIVSAVAVLSHLKDQPIKAFIVRKTSKEHGLKRQIEGPRLNKKDRVILVDDVATSGSSLIEAKLALEKEGIKVRYALAILDRQEGARANLKKAGLKLTSIFKPKDFGV
jgi:orotate phosphoribosyltransferase